MWNRPVELNRKRSTVRQHGRPLLPAARGPMTVERNFGLYFPTGTVIAAQIRKSDGFGKGNRWTGGFISLVERTVARQR